MLQRFYQGIALFDDAVFDLKNLLPLSALLFFQLLYLLLNIMLLIEIGGKPGLALKYLYLILSVLQCLLGGQDQVIRPLFKLLTRLIEVQVVRFQGLADSRFGMSLCLSGESLGNGIGYVGRACIFCYTVKQLFTGFLLQGQALVINSGEKQVFFSFVTFNCKRG